MNGSIPADATESAHRQADSRSAVAAAASVADANRDAADSDIGLCSAASPLVSVLELARWCRSPTRLR